MNVTEKLQRFLPSDTALLITSRPNGRYVTGFPSSAGWVLLTKKAAYFLVDFRYFEKAKRVVRHLDVRLSSLQYGELAELLKEADAQKLYIESESISLSEFARLQSALSEIKVLESDAAEKMLSELRAVKGERELEKIIAAQKLTDETFSYILSRIAKGRSEKEIMLDMEFFMRRSGADAVSFDFVVVSGKNSSLPHGVPTDKLIEKGDFITMDFGAEVDGYRSDMTRTVALGQVTDEQRRVYDTVLSAQHAALAEIGAGKRCCDIDKIARDIIDGAGYEGCFGHSLGHSVGMEIHESPSLSPRCETVLRQGVVMTVEPGIYLEGKFGVRIEDMVFVTENGCRNLTASPKELIIL